MSVRVYATVQPVTAEQVYRLVKAFQEIEDHDTREAVIRLLETAPNEQLLMMALHETN